MGRMDNSNLDDTQPRSVESGAGEAPDSEATRAVEIRRRDNELTGMEATRLVPVQKPAAPAPKPRRLSWRGWTVYGLLALFLIAVASAFMGYNAGIGERKRAEVEQVAVRVEEQYQLGLQDLEAGRYDLARQRFEYVIQLNPNYPGVTDKLAEVLLRLNSTATPTVAPTPTVTPTPDLRGVEELFQQAQTDLANYNWSAAIDTLLALRKADINYRAVWVDDMLYVSFRNRGTDKILK